MVNKKFLTYCTDNLKLEEPDQFNDYFSCVGICAMNAVFSINTKYEAVTNALNRFCSHFNLKLIHSKNGEIPSRNAQKTVTHIYELIKDVNVNNLAKDIFNNRQRTSTTNGILKADASVRFLKILKDFGVDYYQDVPRLINNGTFESCIKEIPGHKSGVSLKYFFMLTGSKDLIKPDRMVLGFIKDAIDVKMSQQESHDLITETVAELRKRRKYSHLSARHLDNLIWNFQRLKSTSKNKYSLICES